MKHVALVTYDEYPNLTESDALLVEPLLKERINSSPIPWNDKTIDWSQFDAIILRSAWNYQFHYQEFLSWLSNLEKIKTRVFNPLPLLRWNSHKSYILDLQNKGVPVIPTIFNAKGKQNNLLNTMNNFHSDNIIIKPAIGASALGVTRIKRADCEKSEESIQKLFATEDYLIQPLMKEVMIEGEYSLVFIGNIFSHAVLKKPKRNEFRSNSEFGAKEEIINPSKSLIRQAADVIRTVESNILYARVDGINANGKFILMELEFIEPHLFFDLKPEAARLFAHTLKTYV